MTSHEASSTKNSGGDGTNKNNRSIPPRDDSTLVSPVNVRVSEQQQQQNGAVTGSDAGRSLFTVLNLTHEPPSGKLSKKKPDKIYKEKILRKIKEKLNHLKFSKIKKLVKRQPTDKLRQDRYSF